MSKNNKLFTIMAEARVKNEYIDFNNVNMIDIIKKSKEEDNLYCYGEDIFVCAYRTKYKGDDAVLLVFMFAFGDTSVNSTSSKSSELIMDVVETLESMFTPIQEYHYERETTESKKWISLLRIVKVDEDY